VSETAAQPSVGADVVDALPADERRSIVLAYFDGHTYREVARLLAVPEAIVKKRIRDGLTRVRSEQRARQPRVDPS
jgi:DNA-directed RNA polymerase specialized sigma24 family protein